MKDLSYMPVHISSSLPEGCAKNIQHDTRGHIWGLARLLKFIKLRFPPHKRKLQNDMFCQLVAYFFTKAHMKPIPEVTALMAKTIEGNAVLRINKVLASPEWQKMNIRGKEIMKNCLNSRDRHKIKLQGIALEGAMSAYEQGYQNVNIEQLVILDGSYGG